MDVGPAAVRLARARPPRPLSAGLEDACSVQPRGQFASGLGEALARRVWGGDWWRALQRGVERGGSEQRAAVTASPSHNLQGYCAGRLRPSKRATSNEPPRTALRCWPHSCSTRPPGQRPPFSARQASGGRPSTEHPAPRTLQRLHPKAGSKSRARAQRRPSAPIGRRRQCFAPLASLIAVLPLYLLRCHMVMELATSLQHAHGKPRARGVVCPLARGRHVQAPAPGLRIPRRRRRQRRQVQPGTSPAHVHPVHRVQHAVRLSGMTHAASQPGCTPHRIVVLARDASVRTPPKPFRLRPVSASLPTFPVSPDPHAH